MPRRDHANLTLAVATILASGFIHVVLWPVGDKVLALSWSSPPVPRAGGVMEVALLAPTGEAPDSERPEPPEPEAVTDDKDEIVQLDRLVDERPPPEPTQQRAEFDNRVDKQTRAPNRPPQAGDAPQVQGQPHTSPDTAKPDRSPASLDLGARGRSDTQADAQGQALDPDRQGDVSRGQDPRKGAPLPPRAGLLGSPEALQKTFGSPGTYDALDDDIEEGAENLLNSKRYKYASFFNRVRNAVAQHWKPAEVHRAHDPDGRVFGAKTRRTNLVIRLNPDGSLAKVMLAESSDAAHLDEEAIRAVRLAAPFDNPPAGLVDPQTGFIEFGFGFIFELRGTTRIFRYQR